MKCVGLVTGLMLVLLSCAKDDGTQIPDVPIEYRITLQEFQIRNKNGILLVDDRGIAGLIICQKPGGGYAAFDRCSSVYPEKKCAVVPDDSSLTATDPCSGAIFSLYDGLPAKPPAEKPLKQYTVQVTRYDITVIN